LKDWTQTRVTRQSNAHKRMEARRQTPRKTQADRLQSPATARGQNRINSTQKLCRGKVVRPARVDRPKSPIGSAQRLVTGERAQRFPNTARRRPNKTRATLTGTRCIRRDLRYETLRAWQTASRAVDVVAGVRDRESYCQRSGCHKRRRRSTQVRIPTEPTRP